MSSRNKTRRPPTKWTTINLLPQQQLRIRNLIAQSGLRSDIALDRIIEAGYRELIPINSDSPPGGVRAAAG